MNEEKYARMVARLEELARREPSKYRLRVGLLAALGYAYLLLVVAGLIAATALLAYVAIELRLSFALGKLAFIMLGLVWIVLRALWVKFPPPEGAELSREDAPQLFALVEEITRSIDAPRIHHVLVNGDFNAAVVQVPRLGAFGWTRNYMVLGLPLLQALTPAQFRAVLAHELGHLSGRHGRFAGWVYRVRQTWVQLLTRLARERRYGALLFVRFFDWYAPYFHAYSFVLARAHEYEADEASARLYGAREAASALVAAQVKGDFVAPSYWGEVFKQADEQPQPVAGSFVRMADALRAPVPAENAEEFVRRALQAETGYEDTHPSLAARLAALGVTIDGDATARDFASDLQPLGSSGTAAQHFIGAKAAPLAERFDEEWRRKIGDDWRARHRRVIQSKRKLAALEEKAAGGARLTADEFYQLGTLTAEFKDARTAVAPLREVPRLHPKYAQARFLLGQILLGDGDESGVACIEDAMARDTDAELPGCVTLFNYFTQQGREEEAARYRERIERKLKAANTTN